MQKIYKNFRLVITLRIQGKKKIERIGASVITTSFPLKLLEVNMGK